MAYFAFQRSGRASANSFGWLMIAITEWVLFSTVELAAPTLQSKILSEQFSYLGIAATPILWLVFVLEYTGNTRWLAGNTKKALAAWPPAIFAAALTNDFHHLMWGSAALPSNGLPGLIFEAYGPAFWTLVVVSFTLVITGILLCVLAYLKAPHIFRQQIGFMLLGSLIPMISEAIYLFDPAQRQGLDWAPFTFAFSAVLLALAFFRYDLLNLLPLAAPLVIENLPDAVVVVDNHDRIVNLNQAAYRWLNVGEEAIGEEAHKVFKGKEVVCEHSKALEDQFRAELGEGQERRWFDFTISALRDQSGRVRGRVLVARDITREQESLQAEQRHARQVEVLNSITQAALQSTDFHEILQALADQTGRILDADGTYITLWDESTHRTIPAAAYGKVRDTYPSIRYDPQERTLTESVLTAGHPLAIDDVFNTEYVSPSVAARFPSRSLLALPLIANEEKLGAALIAFDQPHHFTPAEIAVGEQVGPQIALAIHKARLLDDSFERISQLALLDEVSKSVADSLDEKDILRRTVEAVVKRFGYAQAAISTLDAHGILETGAMSGNEDIGFIPGFRQKIGEGIIGHTAATRQPYLTGDIEHDPYYIHIVKRTGSAMGVPLLDEGQVLGVLYVETSQREAFDQDDVLTLQTLASHVVTAIQKARLYARARERLQTIATLQAISQTITSSLDLEEIFRTVVQLLKDTFEYTHVSIYLLDQDVMRLGAQVGYPGETIFHEIPVTAGVIGRTVLTRQNQFIPDVTQDPDFLRASNEVESEICVPLLREDEVLGVINVEAGQGHPLKENDIDLITALAGPVSIAVDNARLHSEVKSLALTDSLTDLLNRRAFDDTLVTEIARAERYGYPLALIIIDLDNFKSYNDQWGHPAGDKRLIEVAKLLESNIRSPDIAARYGGEEFAIILPYTSKIGAVSLAERLRRAFEAQAGEVEATDGYIAGFTISLGVATLPENGTTAADLLIAADNAELAAKRLGKNRVCVADGTQEILKMI